MQKLNKFNIIIFVTFKLNKEAPSKDKHIISARAVKNLHKLMLRILLSNRPLSKLENSLIFC